MGPNRIRIVMVGVGGYGSTYLSCFEKGVLDWDTVSLEGAVDPYADKSPFYSLLRERNIPVFSELSDFYREKSAELAVISTPIHLHRPQCETALQSVSHVLCEKPLAPGVEDWERIRLAERLSGKRVGVGFQWSFSHTMLTLKQDILSGRFGKPIRMKSLVCWPRDDAYYDGSAWKGRLRDLSGSYVNDSVISNATAHYLHNIFFMMGQTLDTSLLPSEMSAEIYRSKEIETYDTCFLKGRFPSDAEFFYAASHACTVEKDPVFTYEFENAVIGLNDAVNDNIVRARFPDGVEREYGNPFTFEETSGKLRAMLGHARDGGPITCGTETVYPHVYVCDALSKISPTTFPNYLLLRNHKGIFCPPLDGALHECYEKSSLPSEKGYAWSAGPTVIRPSP